MSKYSLKNLPSLRLADLLRRRKINLDAFLQESGIQSYEALVRFCERMGCLPPSKPEFLAVRPVVVTSLTDGIVVLDPPPLPLNLRKKDVQEQIVDQVEPPPPGTSGSELDLTSTEDPTKAARGAKRKSKKDKSSTLNMNTLEDENDNVDEPPVQ